MADNLSYNPKASSFDFFFSSCKTFHQQFLVFFSQKGATTQRVDKIIKHLTTLSIRLNSPVTFNFSFMKFKVVSCYFWFRLDLDMRHLILTSYFLCLTGNKLTETWHKKKIKRFSQKWGSKNIKNIHPSLMFNSKCWLYPYLWTYFKFFWMFLNWNELIKKVPIELLSFPYD